MYLEFGPLGNQTSMIHRYFCKSVAWLGYLLEVSFKMFGKKISKKRLKQYKLARFIMSIKVSKSAALAYFSILKLAYATLK